MNENHIRPKAFDGGLRRIEVVLRALPVGEHVRRLVELQIALQEEAAVDTGLAGRAESGPEAAHGSS